MRALYLFFKPKRNEKPLPETMNKHINLTNKASVAISAAAPFGLFIGFVPALNLGKPVTSLNSGLWFSPLP